MLDLTDWQNKKYQTRDGRPVRVLCVDAKTGGENIIGMVVEGNKESLASWFSDGTYLMRGDASDNDLINAKTKKEGWVNVFPGGTVSVVAYATKEQADTSAHPCRFACVKIEWEE